MGREVVGGSVKEKYFNSFPGESDFCIEKICIHFIMQECTSLVTGPIVILMETTR